MNIMTRSPLLVGAAPWPIIGQGRSGGKMGMVRRLTLPN
jgi:hypothetical protein